MKANDSGELLHRREFFKKAAKGTLPIVAAIVVPSIFTSCGGGDDDDITGCMDCSGTCASDCSSSCVGQSSSSTCSNCANNCTGGCDTSCSNTCKNNSSNNSDSGDEDEISKATGEIGGYEYVDLGLSVKWARYNVGASRPQQYGSYLEFVEGSIDNYSSVKKELLENGFGTGDSISGTSFDPATKRWGNYWKLPTKDELDELLENCSCEWFTYEGVKGIKFKSKINGRSIFLPAAGSILVDEGLGVGRSASFWTGTFERLTSSNYKSTSAYVFSHYYLSTGKTNYYTPIQDSKESVRPVTDGTASPTTCGGGCSSNCANNSTSSSSCSGCSSTCSNGCKERCEYNCAATCDSHCYGTCNDSCGGSCRYVSAGTNCSGCAQTCYNRCYHDCSYACSTNCQSSCVNGSK